MFLSQLQKENPELIDYAFKLHSEGKILPDTYVIDLDMISENTKKIVAAAKANQVELLYMTKQLGRNPVIAKTVEDAGIESAVVVDFREAETFMHNHLHLGNVGHLVQIPQHLMKKILAYGTKYVTLYSLANAKALNQAAASLDIQQKVILKVVGDEDDIYPGQSGGFTMAQLDEQLPDIQKLNNLDIVGLTTFPAILYSSETHSYEPTQNVKSVAQAKSIFEKYGASTDVVSLPSATATTSLPLIHELGGTEAEPGHALSGTTPLHAAKDQPEKPAYCYVSEISHDFGDHSFIYGGGYYRRGHLKNALIKEGNKLKRAEVLPLDNSSIDYYLELDQKFEAGAPVVMASRTQIFVTRSTVALVKGLHSTEGPQLVGLYDSLGKPLTEDMR